MRKQEERIIELEAEVWAKGNHIDAANEVVVDQASRILILEDEIVRLRQMIIDRDDLIAELEKEKIRMSKKFHYNLKETNRLNRRLQEVLDESGSS